MIPLLLLAPLTIDSPSFQDAVEKYSRRITPVVQVIDAARRAVVYIQTEGVTIGQDFWRRLVAQRFNGEGSGVVILKDGYILTNYHVVKDAKNIVVSFDKQYDEQEYPADVISFVEEKDLALLKINRALDFPTIPLGTSSDLMLGETVIAIGNPYGQTHTATQGIISGLHRNVQIPGAGPGGMLKFGDLIQTDAAINFGNSGGPLLNINGELIGINSAMNAQAQSIGFAIPVDRIKDVLKEQLLAPETAPTWLGFDVDPGDHLQVAKVVPGSPAALAGMKPGDCIVAIGGQPVSKQDEYRLARVGLSPQRDVELQVENHGKTRRLKMEAWDKPDGILFEHLGMKVEVVALGRNSFVKVSEVRPGGPADALGLKPDDLVDAVRPVQGAGSRAFRIVSREALASLVSRIPSGTALEIDIYRDINGNGRYETDELHRGTLTVQ